MLDAKERKIRQNNTKYSPENSVSKVHPMEAKYLV